MARQPTGNPRGRPKGSGHLEANQTRLTVRMPDSLLARLEAYEAGRTSVRGTTPRLSRVVRQAVEHFLVCPNKRQTRTLPRDGLSPSYEDSRQTVNTREALEGINGQTENTPAPTADASRAALGARLRQMREQGMSLQQMADLLRGDGTPTPSGKGQWHKETVSRRLRATA